MVMCITTHLTKPWFKNHPTLVNHPTLISVQSFKESGTHYYCIPQIVHMHKLWKFY